MKKQLDKTLDLIIRANLVFTATVFLWSWFEHPVPDSLIIGWFGFWGWELMNMKSIKVSKIKKGETDEQLPDH